MRDKARMLARALFNKGCNCGSVDNGVGIQHEPTCGWPTEFDIADALLEFRKEGLEEAAEICDERAKYLNHAGMSIPNRSEEDKLLQYERLLEASHLAQAIRRLEAL